MLKLRNKLLKKNEKGFTLVELIVVIAILGILAAIAVPRVIGSLDNAKKRADETSAKAVESAAQLHYADKGAYPADIAALVTANYLDENPLDATGDEKLQYYSSAAISTVGKVTLTK